MDYPIIDLAGTGKRIRAFRKERHLSVRSVCEFLGGISEQAVYKWEAGSSLPTVDNLYALSILFQVNMNDMIEEADKASSVHFAGFISTEIFQLQVECFHCTDVVQCTMV